MNSYSRNIRICDFPKNQFHNIQNILLFIFYVFNIVMSFFWNWNLKSELIRLAEELSHTIVYCTIADLTITYTVSIKQPYRLCFWGIARPKLVYSSLQIVYCRLVAGFAPSVVMKILRIFDFQIVRAAYANNDLMRYSI